MFMCLLAGFIATMLVSILAMMHYGNRPSDLAIGIAWFCFYLAFMLLDKAKKVVVQ